MSIPTVRPRYTAMIGSVVLLACAAGVALAAHDAAQTSAGALTPAKPTRVLFLCPHGAAKSVLASAYFQKLAKARGLNVRVEAAGTEPDATVSPIVAEHLKKQGYRIPIDKPRAVTSDDLGAADVVISMGCDVSALPVTRGTLRRWDDVPGPSENLTRADEAIRQHVIELVDELVRRSREP